MPHLTISTMKAVQAVALTRSFSEAAALLHTSQPAVTQQVKAIEKQLGFTLFERGRQGASLTAEGEALLPLFQNVLDALDTVRVESARLKSGVSTLRLGAIPTLAPYTLPAIVRHIRSQSTETMVTIAEAQTTKLLDLLLNSNIDMALLATPVLDNRLDYREIARDELLVGMSEHHQLAQNSTVSISDLMDQEILLIEDGHCLRGQAIEVCNIAGAKNTKDVFSASLSTVCQMVSGGHGVTVLPAAAAAVECRAGSGVVALPFETTDSFSKPYRTISIVWRKQSPHAHVFERIADSLTQVSLS